MLVIMMVDHIELYPSIYDYFTGRGRLFVSAAEGFFFLSGILVGMVYKRRASRGAKFIFGRMWLRAIELYILAAVTTIGYAVWASWAGNTAIKYGLPNPTDWAYLIKETLMLQYGWGWADFLMRFCILMLIAPFAFYGLMRGKWRFVLTISILTWLLRGQNFTFAWQLLFFGGMTAGYYWDEINNFFLGLKPKTARLLKHSAYILAGISFVVSYLIVYLLSLLNDKIDSLNVGLRNLTLNINSINEQVWVYAEKWTLGPLRVVLFLLWFSVLYLIVNKYSDAINHYTKGSLELLGRNSLFVYLLHSLIVFVFHLYIIPEQTSLLLNFIITGVALGLLIAGTAGYKNLRKSYPNIAINSIYVLIVSRVKNALPGKN